MIDDVIDKVGGLRDAMVCRREECGEMASVVESVVHPARTVYVEVIFRRSCARRSRLGLWERFRQLSLIESLLWKKLDSPGRWLD